MKGRRIYVYVKNVFDIHSDFFILHLCSLMTKVQKRQATNLNPENFTLINVFYNFCCLYIQLTQTLIYFGISEGLNPVSIKSFTIYFEKYLTQ